MLLKRPLDLVGTMPENRVVGERHPLTTEADKVFTLELGSFYSKSVVIRDVTTGNPLRLETDYKLLGYNDLASKASAGKQVDTIVVITRTDVSTVAVDYQAVGGVYSNLSNPFINLLEQVRNTDRSKIDWMEQIINKPDSIAPVPHTHEPHELAEIEDGIGALTKLLASIYSLDTKDYRGVYDTLYNKIRNVRTELDTSLDFVNSELDLIVTKSNYQPGDVIVGDFTENPVKWYPEVDWVLLPESFLYGNTYTSGTDPLSVDIKPGTGLLARTTHIYVAVPKGGAKYTIERSRSAINEGESVDILLLARDISPGSLVPYIITGVRQEDINQPLTGSFLLDGNLTGRLTIQAIEDFETEGDEIMRISLVDNPDVFTSVRINDTSKTPVFDTFFSSDFAGQQRITSFDEGATCYYQIRGSNVQEGTEVNLFYGGTASPADFSTALPSTAKLNGQTFTMAVTAIADERTEGNETLLIKVSLSDEAHALVATTITVVDTSKTQSWEIYFSSDVAGNSRISSIGEGQEFSVQVIGNNVPNSTVVGLNYSGTANINDLDFRFDNLSITNGRGTATMRTRADFETEGDESLIVTVIYNSTPVANNTLIIMDTSTSSASNIKFSSNSSGTNTITAVNEGDTFYLVVTAVNNLPDGTVVNLLYEGTASDADFTKPRPRSATVLNQRAVVEYTVVADQLDEGDEIMRVRVISTINNAPLGVEQITIRDTSRGARYQVLYTGSATSNDAITSINEGQTAWLTVIGENLPNGKILQCEQYIGGLLAIVTNGDVDVNPPTTMQINNNRGSIPIQVRADMRTEGNEPLLGIVKDGNVEVGRKEITVIDTSITPTYNMWFSATPNGDDLGRNFVAGQVFYLVVQTTGVVAGTRLYLGPWDGTPGNMESLPPDIVINGTRTSVALQGKVIFGPEWAVGVQLCADASRTQNLVHNWFGIGSTVPDIYFSSNAAGSNRVTGVNEDDVVYLHVTIPSIANGITIPIQGAIAGSGPQASNGHVWEDVNERPVTNAGRAYTVIRLKGDQQKTGDFGMWFQVVGTGYRADCTVRDTSLPPVITVTVPDQYNGRYVIARELFKRQVGRDPVINDKIRFVIPQHITLRGIITLWGYVNGDFNNMVAYTYGSSGLDLGGMMSDDLTVDVYGKIISSPLYQDDPTWGTVSSTRIRKVSLGSQKPLDFFNIGMSADAISTNVRTKLIIRNGGMVLGMGGWDPAAPGEVELISQPNGTPFTTGRGANALGATSRFKDLRPADYTFVVKVENGGTLSGGGGGGGQGGTVMWSSLTPVYCPMAHIGGGGAPYGGQIWAYNGDSGDVVCPDKFVYEDAGLTNAVCTAGAAQWSVAYGASATLNTGGDVLPRFSGNGLRRDFVGGRGGAVGQSGQAGATYIMGNMNQATRESISRPGQAGLVVTAGTNIIYDNSIA